MRVGENGALYRLPGIDVEIGLFAKQAARSQCDQTAAPHGIILAISMHQTVG